jgi:hypothetical protein
VAEDWEMIERLCGAWSEFDEADAWFDDLRDGWADRMADLWRMTTDGEGELPPPSMADLV